MYVVYYSHYPNEGGVFSSKLSSLKEATDFAHTVLRHYKFASIYSCDLLISAENKSWKTGASSASPGLTESL